MSGIPAIHLTRFESSPEHVVIPYGASRDSPYASSHDDSNQLQQLLLSRDVLTQLPNRRWLHRRLWHELELTRGKASYQFAVILVNLNRFRAINENFGQQHGDALLIDVALRLQDAIRNMDGVCRIGDDEFAVVISDTQENEDVKTIARRLLSCPVSHLHVDGRSLPVTAAAGAVTVTPGFFECPDDVMRAAGIALARAKARGGAQIECYHPESDAQESQDLSLEAQILRGIELEEFRLYYQPIISLKERNIAGFESLLRWQHPKIGLVGPGQFIPTAERNGLIEHLGIWIVVRACKDLKTMHDKSANKIFITLNISNRQLCQKGLSETVLNHIWDARIDPTSLCFELTETTMIDDFDTVRQNLKSLRDAGIRMLIDDFGVGFSSLHSLYRLAVDGLKIDRSFISALHHSPKGVAMVRSIIEMGHALGLDLVAEGIESKHEFDSIISLGCDYAQGFLFSRGVEHQAALQMLLQKETY